jgi:hypothetical protein
VAQPKGDVGCRAQVREERGLLGDKCGLAMAGREPETLIGVSEGMSVEGYAASDRHVVSSPVEPGQQSQERSLAGA